MTGNTNKILVLGANGFIGRNIVEYLLQKNYAVFSPRRQTLNLLDTEKVDKYIAELQPDTVISSAVNISSLSENLQIYFNLERCSKNFGKMITLGSGAEYDMQNYQPMMSEEYFGQHVPVDIYGLSKYVISNDIQKKPRNIVNIRLLGIFGKHEDYTRRFISNNICKAIAGLGISIHQNMRFDFLYVNDFLQILEMFIIRKSEYNNYNICTGQPIELLEIANTISDIHGQSEQVIIKEKGFKPEYSANNTRFCKEFGTFKFTNIKDSVKELYQWYENLPEIDQYCAKLKNKNQ